MRAFFLVLCCFLFFLTQAQQQLFTTVSLEQALSSAASQHKLIFVQMQSRDCIQCNDVAEVSFANQNLQEKLKASCVTLKVFSKTKLWNELAAKYRTNNGGISLFLDSAGTIIHRYNATSSNPASYLEQLNLALGKRNNGDILRALENRYTVGDRGASFLESLLIARNHVGLETDSLLDVYASVLEPDSLKTRRVILFLARLSPVLGSPADKALRRNPEVFNQYWFSMPAEQRVAINNNIIRKTKQLAIERKDINEAYLAATFAKSTYYDVYNAQRIYDQTMIDYFRDAGDTLKYIPMAVYYFDTYFMTIDVDSIKGIDSLRKKQLLETSPRETVTISGNTRAVRTSIIYSPITQQYSNQLKTAAWNFYTMTKDSAALSRGLNWAKRAVEFYPSLSALDIYARLLYRFGDPKKAIELEQKAVETAKAQQLPTKELESIVSKMKNGDAKIDEFL